MNMSLGRHLLSFAKYSDINQTSLLVSRKCLRLAYQIADEVALRRTERAGVTLTTTNQLIAESAKDWISQDGGKLIQLPPSSTMTKQLIPVSRLRLSLVLWGVGMLGVVAITVTLLPSLLEGEVLPMPLWVVSLLSLGQSAVIVALAVWAGVVLTPVVGLDAPVFVAAIAKRALGPAVRPQLVPGFAAGLLGGGFLFAAWRYAPAILEQLPEQLGLPLFARVLYGGITEELLLRWGLMTILVWLAWAFLQRRRGAPAPMYIWLAIALSALLFGAGHLPAASVLVGALNSAAVVWVVGVNAAFGVLFGYLFWRHGLESAMIAHGLTHVVHYTVESL